MHKLTVSQAEPQMKWHHKKIIKKQHHNNKDKANRITKLTERGERGRREGERIKV